jgi:hypothetical protein
MWLAKADDGAALQSLAFEFLEADLLHSGWTYIWSHMWRDPGPALDRLRGLGMRFLMENPAESGWNWVFERLSTDNCRDAEQLWEIAAVRLENTRGDAKLWSYDWKQAWDTICGTSEKKKKFCVLGLAFLADDHVPETWPMIWNRLWDSGLADKQKLAERARFLLSNVTTKTREQVLKRLDGDLMPRPWNNSEDYSWSDEWVDRWKVVRTDEERGRLLEEAYRWLSQPAGGGWSKIWRYVWAGSNSAARNVSLTKLAHRWLEAKDFAHKRWPILWCELWDFPGLPERKAVAELGRRFLQTASMDDGYLEVSKRLSSRTSDLRH